MIIERPIDCGLVYQRTRRRLIEVARGLNPAQLATIVPATPAWTVHDAIAHVVGLATDLNSGEFGRGNPDEWTAAQVRERLDHSVEELAQEWDREGPRFEDGLRLFGYEFGSHFVGDLVQHAADVDHALGRPRLADDDEALLVGLDFYLDSFHETLTEAAAGRATVSVDGESFEVGDGPAVASLSAGRFELFRALGGRRSAAQIRRLEWVGDVDAILGLVSRYNVPSDDLVEP
ncbi:MAG: maleylpyruvate isomerase family mycothiol-dependent enzyme [Microthrixaceae bacterium]